MRTGRADPGRLRTGSLRRRVVLAVLALLVVVIIAVCGVVNVILSNRLYDDARSRMSDRAAYASVLATRGGLSAQELADALTGQGITAAVQRGSNVVVGRDRPAAPGGPPAQRPGKAPAAPGTAATVAVHSRGEMLVATIPVTDGTLVLSSSTMEIARTLSTLHRIEWLVGGGVVLIGALVLVTIVGAALRPLRRVTRWADTIRTGDRGRRLRPTRPGTDIGRTASALDEMLEELEAAETRARVGEDRMRQLLADVSHDLRTPIAGIISSAELVLHHDPGRVRREQQLVELIREGRRAGRLVDDLLLMVRLDDPSLQGEALLRDEVPLPVLLERATSSAKLRHPDRVVGVDPSLPASVAGDPDRLARVLGNLIENACAATTTGGHVELAASAIGPDRVAIDVRDDGPGVPDADRERIFDRFVRLDGARQAGGSGLGLPIARAIARAHGGELRCLPSARGAWFRLELPVAPVAVPAQDPTPAAPTVLMVGASAPQG